MTEEEIENHFSINTIANINLTRKLLPLITPNKQSQILICSSSLCNDAREQYSIQGATKVAYKYFVDSLRKGICPLITYTYQYFLFKYLFF